MTRLRTKQQNEQIETILCSIFSIKGIVKGVDTEQDVISALRGMGFIRKDIIYPVQKFIDKGYFVVRDRVEDNEVVLTIDITVKGFSHIVNGFGYSIDQLCEETMKDLYGNKFFC